MRPTPTLTFLLRQNLLAVLDGTFTSKQLNAIVNLSVALALELLTRKSGGKRLSSSQGLNEKDLAYDSIADLFQRNEEGRFVQLDAYFSSFDLDSVSDEELLVALLRLVYARVNQALFRMYQDIDPGFYRILRNIKLAVERMNQFEQIDRFGESSIAPALCETNEHLPPLDPDEVQHYLMQASVGTENIPQMLGKLSVFLRQQECHSRILPVITVAKILQSVYAVKNQPLLLPPTVEHELPDSDTGEIVRNVCNDVKTESAKKYLARKKVSEEAFDAYFDVIESSIMARIVEQNGSAISCYELLKAQLPDLTPEEYRKHHRAKLEYLGALAYKRAIGKLKENM